MLTWIGNLVSLKLQRVIGHARHKLGRKNAYPNFLIPD